MSETKTDAEWKWVDKNVFSRAVQQMIKEVKDGNFHDAEEATKLLKEVSQAFSKETIYDISDEKLIGTLKSIICRLANKGRAIIVGRSAGVILKDVPNRINIRLEAPLSWRINRIMQIKDCSQAEAREYIDRIDKKRDSFIEKMIGRKAENNDFDIIFNYATLDDEQIIDAIISILRNKKIISSHAMF